jgi:predicted Zn-dependent protease
MIGTIPLPFMGGSGGLCVRVTPEAGLAMPMGYLASSGEGEAKADELGFGYMESASYDPGALADFYERIPRPKEGTVSRVFDPGRIMPEKTRAQAEVMRNARTFVVTTSEFEKIRRRLAAFPSAGAKTRDSQPSLKKQAGK